MYHGDPWSDEIHPIESTGALNAGQQQQQDQDNIVSSALRQRQHEDMTQGEGESRIPSSDTAEESEAENDAAVSMPVDVFQQRQLAVETADRAVQDTTEQPLVTPSASSSSAGQQVTESGGPLHPPPPDFVSPLPPIADRPADLIAASAAAVFPAVAVSHVQEAGESAAPDSSSSSDNNNIGHQQQIEKSTAVAAGHGMDNANGVVEKKEAQPQIQKQDGGNDFDTTDDASATAEGTDVSELDISTDNGNSEMDDLTTPLVPVSETQGIDGRIPPHNDSQHEESMRSIDLSPPPSPSLTSQQQQQTTTIEMTSTVGSTDGSKMRRRTEGPGTLDALDSHLTDPTSAPIRFGTFINKQMFRARRLFRRSGSVGEDGSVIAGTVKIDPATGSLLPVQSPGVPGAPLGTIGGGGLAPATTHASDLRRRKSRIRQYCERTEYGRSILRSTLTVMHFLGRLLLWTSIIAMVVMIIYYSHELRQNGTDPHLIAWFSAGAFVLLGFPISIYGIFTHLSNYYQPHIQCYVVRILWMVPIYSIESWLCLRFHRYAIYIETLRDCYESFVLYSFFQFLIQVLGGEEQLILMLKDKSPTRGVHIWGFDWCIRPWLMGQPVSRTYVVAQSEHSESPGGVGAGGLSQKPPIAGATPRTIKQVRWTSPFLVKCKRGILQYVVLKFVCSVSAMLLEVLGWYHEGSFSPRYGYFYICFLTNFSQCWALYCLVFFYYATKNELGPIRPVGKFLSVKALVFFTWWQSVGISILFQMGMIPHYSFDEDDANLDWTAEDVAKGLQDYLICIEMFGAAILHMFVFPHTDYLQPIGTANSPNSRVYQRDPSGMTRTGRRLGRKGKVFWNGATYNVHRDDRSVCSKSSSLAPDQFDLEIGPMPPASAFGMAPPIADNGSPRTAISSDDDEGGMASRRSSTGNFSRVDEDVAGEESSVQSGVPSAPLSGNSSLAYSQHSQHQQPKGFVHAFLDSTLPKDVLDESVGYLKGNFKVEKKTLLSHAATSDEYDLFSKRSKRRKAGAAGARKAGEAKKESASKTLFPKSMGYPGVPVMKSVKEQD